MEDSRSQIIRQKIFEWLSIKVKQYDDVLPYKELFEGFELDGQRIPLLGPKGIFKPAVIKYFPLSITTSPNSLYDDKIDEQYLHYRYRGKNPNHPDNVQLKEAIKHKVPLAYFHGIVKGKYLVHFPVYIEHADDANLVFRVSADTYSNIIWQKMNVSHAHDIVVDEVRREYVTREVVTRMHQRSFREKVLHAYREHCAFCRLKHPELLDAAHIIPDSSGGEPTVKNGISLCKIHHAAFDKNILGINDSYIIEVRKDILEEVDGPMLKYGLQNLHFKKMVLPTKTEYQPDRNFIRRRFEEFIKAS
jgi:putative restriction endonuclease